MALEYSELIKNLDQIKFARAGNELLDEFFYYTNDKPAFIENHKVFYPKGLFTEKGLENFYFFTETKIARVSFYESIDIQLWKYNQISSYKLSMLNRYGLKLEIYLNNRDTLIFGNEIDTSANRQKTFGDKIKSIYKLLEEL